MVKRRDRKMAQKLSWAIVFLLSIIKSFESEREREIKEKYCTFAMEKVCAQWLFFFLLYILSECALASFEVNIKVKK